jgi:flagellar hook-associated protein 1 FlgK
MSGLSQLVNIGLSGLLAAQEGIQTVSNNTANVNTPGYNVESINQVELPGSGGPPGTVGAGTDVTSIQRAFDQFVYQEVIGASAANQAAQIMQTNTTNLASIFPVASGGAGGLGAAITSFFSAASQVAQDPTSAPNRAAFLSNAQSLASLFQSTGSELATNLTTDNSQIAGAVQQVNALTQQIAALNAQVMNQTGASTAASNSLLDQRDSLVQQLAQQLGLVSIAGTNGAVDLYTSSGAALVNGASSFSLAVTSGGYGDGTSDVTYGPTGQDLTNSLSGGNLGGLLAFRTELVSAQDNVGGLAVALASAVNSQQSLGLDLKGNLGQPLFSVAGPTVYPAAANTGSGTLSAAITDPNSFVPGDFILTKTASGFTATNIATGQVTTLGNGPTLSLDGMTVTVSGAVQTGDSFKLEPTVAAPQSLTVALTDPSGIAAASPYVVTAGALTSGGAITDKNVGNVQATAGGPAASGGLPAGTVIVPAGNFGQNLTIAFTSATSFNVLSSSGTVIASGSFSASSGAEIAIAYPAPAPAGEVATFALSPGTAVKGDSFVVSPGGVGSNGNMTAMAGLATQTLLAGQTLGSAYATLVTTLGSRGQEAQVAAQAAQAVLTRAQTTQQSISGVNLDQQAADLVSYQQAYQAAAQVIAAAQTLFNSLLQAI